MAGLAQAHEVHIMPPGLFCRASTFIAAGEERDAPKIFVTPSRDPQPPVG
ncbi:hypothetical protein GCM10011392_17870 [Wenxinia marina]|nr:hypothetical protein GCM10011392_17870 [Wenxinia marina]